MGNEEYIIQWDDMTPEAKAKKERLEQDPSFRTDHMAYMEGMDQISTDIRDMFRSDTIPAISLILSRWKRMMPMLTFITAAQRLLLLLCLTELRMRI